MSSTVTRRRLLQALTALAPAAASTVAAATPSPRRADSRMKNRGEPRGEPWQALEVGPQRTVNNDEPLSADVLPRGVRARFVDNVNGIRMHVLDAGFAASGVASASRPAILLVHGFPELAYSWRKVMLPLAAAGFHVIAPDLRGYGRSGGTDVTFDDDLAPWRTLNEVTDMVALVSAFGYRSVGAVVGHDFGSPVAAWCAVVRPDIFRSVALMSAPFAGPPALPFDTADAASRASAAPDTIYDDLAKLTPPRKHYQRYY